MNQDRIDEFNKKELRKDMNKYIKLNSKNSRIYYELRRNKIKEKYKEENENITLEELKLEKERISTRIESASPSYLAMMISIIGMFFNMFIPNIAEYTAKMLVNDKFVWFAKATIITLYSAAVFVTLFITVCKQMEEIRIFTVLRSVIEELEIEETNKLNNDYYKNDISGIEKQISDIKVFLGI